MRSTARRAESQTTSTTILIFVGLYLVLVLESTGMRTSPRRARAIPALCILLAAIYVAIISLAPARGYFALAPPSALPVLVSIICTIFAIGALGAIGLSLTRPGGEQVELVVPFPQIALSGLCDTSASVPGCGAAW